VIDGIARAKPWRRRASDLQADTLGRLQTFAFAWFLVPLLFFSFSGSKLPGYILPVLPALALLVGCRLSQLTSKSETSKWAIRMTAGLCLLFALATPLYAWRSGQPSMLFALMIAVLLGVAGIVMLVCSKVTSVLSLAGATLALVVAVLNCWAPKLGEQETAKRLLQLADQRGHSETAIYGLLRDDRSPEFYASGRVVYGQDHEPIMYEGTAPVVAESIARKQALLVLVPLKDVAYFTAQQSVQVDVIGDNGRVAIVAVRAR